MICSYHALPPRPFTEWLALMKPDNRILTVADFCVRAKEILNLPEDKIRGALLNLMDLAIWDRVMREPEVLNLIGEIANKIRKNGRY